MSSPRLRTQFEKLFEHFNGEDVGIQLDDITEILFCTRRNARIVLNKLAEEGWIEWKPAAGRGKLSQLSFKRNRNDVSENLARSYLEQGKIEQALNVLDRDASKLTQVIQGYLGVQHQEGKQVVRLPYYRPLSMLNPRKPHRRSEQHIIRQIFSGLVRLNDDEQVEPDLAHQWEQLAPDCWRFYIRPGVRFHNGIALKVEHIIETLELLKDINQFTHFKRISSPSPWVVDIELIRPDYQLPISLCESPALITLTEKEQAEDHDTTPIGTGPFCVEVNDEKSLILEAFEGYFGYRSLVDRVEVWVIDEVHSSIVFPSLSHPVKPERSSIEDVELDPGSTLLLLNRRSGIAREPSWSQYLSRKLSSFNIFRLLPEQQIAELGLIIANGIKPGWYHHTPKPLLEPPFKEAKIKIAYHSRHPIFPSIAKVIESLLKEDGLKSEFVRYEHSVESVSDIDIWIKPMGIGTRRDDALAGWLLNYSDIELMAPDRDFSQWFEFVKEWQSEPNKAFPANALGRSLVETEQIVPLFHCWLGVSKDHCGSLQNAKCNALGWFDFSHVWVKPELVQQS